MWYVRDVLYAVLYVRVSCYVVRGCAVSKRYINVCNYDMFSVVYAYHDHLKFCVMMVEGMYVVVNVMLSLMSVMSPPPALSRAWRGGVVLCLCDVRVWIRCVEGRSLYLCIVLGGYLRI